MSCGICGRKSDLPHACAYCGGTFCDDHALPENHNCYVMSIRNWETYEAHETAKGNVPIPPHKYRPKRETETEPEGWTNIEDYDPNPKAEEIPKAEDQPPKDSVHEDPSLVDSEGKWVKEPETATEEKSKPTFLSRLFKRKRAK